MLFHVYGAEAVPQWIAMLGVLAALGWARSGR